MIREQAIIEWRREAPWTADWMVEQDLVISRALVEIYSVPDLADRLAFRGGTALYKLYLRPAARYSEDIDLVQGKRPSRDVHRQVGLERVTDLIKIGSNHQDSPKIDRSEPSHG